MKTKWTKDDSCGIGAPLWPVPGIYAIFYLKELVYIGQSQNIQNRLLFHLRSYIRVCSDNYTEEDGISHSLFGCNLGDTGFNSFYPLSYRWAKDSRTKSERMRREARLIKRLKPRLNIVHAVKNWRTL